MTGTHTIPDAFRRQALACRHLGSPFTGRVCEALADGLTTETAFGARILGWAGHTVNDALALRAAGALNALARSGGCAALAAAYPPHEADDERLRDAIAAAMAGHDDFLTCFLDSAPQTNEAGRSNALLGGALHVAAATGLPLALHEIGSSAGLNLVFDRYAYELGAARWGAPDAAVTIAAEWTGGLPPLDAPLRVVSRAGCDINPLDPARDRERLLAYIWPDQTARLARIATALDEAARTGSAVEKADAAEWVERHFGPAGRNGIVRVLMHTIVWQYLPAATRARIEAAMAAAGARATEDAPIAWLRAEPDKIDKLSAAVTLTLWQGGAAETQTLGRTDFHGRWTQWGG
ncbi:DUF2332 family protein [Parvibaculum sp.]|uniref:DUF2332 domain-containing protein n=1 Tax=Parvibaculum sp. TaxID=2024848 RepID=UPI001DDA4798|nr:DUF2332 family protein [Parvibaculum sp.]MBX3490674.1 DUF2332 family protein [Parvibaculum sp.]MCW5728578.1 DUF2332 family protein [Parvibaculum sp.]